MNTIAIHSSQGDIVCSKRDGHVVKIHPDGDADKVFTRIFQFDTKEWLAQWGGYLPDDMDILDVGYWYTKLDATVHYEGPENEWRSRLIEDSPLHAARRAKTLLNDAAGMLAAAQCQLEPHNRLAGESGQCNSLRQAVADHAGRLSARMDGLMDEDATMPEGYDPGNDIGQLSNSLGCHMMPEDRVAFDRVQQYILDLQARLEAAKPGVSYLDDLAIPEGDAGYEESKAATAAVLGSGVYVPKPKGSADRACDARDLNCIAEKLYGMTEAGEDEPAQNALDRLGRNLCGQPVAVCSDSPPVWE